jgi:hypothetical protein
MKAALAKTTAESDSALAAGQAVSATRQSIIVMFSDLIPLGESLCQ